MALLALARGIAAGRYVLTSRSEIIQFTDRIQVKASTKPCATNQSELAAEDSAGSDTPEDNPRTASENGEPVLAQQPHGTEKGPTSLNSLLAPSIVDVKSPNQKGLL